jgi:DNA polymerase elongation subunit (family B)
MNSYDSVEDATLKKHRLYRELYINEIVIGGRILLVKANDEQQFSYTPIVRSFDLEMLSLNSISKESEPYMVSYIVKDNKYIIYSKSFYDRVILDTDKCKYIMCNGELSVIKTLLRQIVLSTPDVIVGYNIYIADIPIIYHTVRRYLYDFNYEFFKVKSYFHLTKKIDKVYVDSEHGNNIKIANTHCIDMYVNLLRLLPSDQHGRLNLETVGPQYIGASKDPLSHRDLRRIYYSGTEAEKISVMYYCLQDSKIVLNLYFYFNVWNYHSGVTKISGIDSHRNMSKGNIEVTYGFCSKLTMNTHYIDTPNTKFFKLGRGLVLDVKKGRYNNLYCIDLNSLYPSIAIQHNIDFTTKRELALLYIKDELLHPICENNKVEKDHSVCECESSHLPNYIWNEHRTLELEERAYYYVAMNSTVDVLECRHGNKRAIDKTVKGILPTVLKNLLDMRTELKVLIRNAEQKGDIQQKQILSSEEQAYKTFANAACGAIAEDIKGNPILYARGNDVITCTSRKILQLAVNTCQRLDVKVIDGDTDSLFVVTDRDIQEVIDEVHKQLSLLIRFKLKYIAKDFIITNKKHYIKRTSDNVIRISGYKAAKSSSCKAARKCFKRAVEILLDEGVSNVMQFYNETLSYYQNLDNISVQDFTYRFNYKRKKYKQGTSRRIIIETMKSRGVELISRNSLDVTIVHTEENYRYLHSIPPNIELSHSSNTKSKRIFIVEEIGKDVSLIDVKAVLDLQCWSDLFDILSYCVIYSELS